MFRVALRNHITLSDIADTKANILLSVNAIIISLVLSNLVSKKAYNLHRLQTGFLYHYAFLMLVGTTILVGILQLGDNIFSFLDYRLFGIFLIAIFFLKKSSN